REQLAPAWLPAPKRMARETMLALGVRRIRPPAPGAKRNRRRGIRRRLGQLVFAIQTVPASLHIEEQKHGGEDQQDDLIRLHSGSPLMSVSRCPTAQPSGRRTPGRIESRLGPMSRQKMQGRA